MKLFETENGVDDYIKMAAGYNLLIFKPLFEKYLPFNKKILELGMGPGNDYQWLSGMYRITGSDYSKIFISRAKRKFPRGDFLVLNAITLDTKMHFDAVFSSKVFQYFDLDVIRTSLKNQYNLLSQNGYIFHTFWIGDSEYDFDDMHVYYHNHNKILSIISEKFKIMDKKIYKEFENNDSLFIIAQKRN